MSIRIIVAGATGRMGQEVVKLIQQTEEFTLVGAVSPSHQGKLLNQVLPIADLPSLEINGSLEEALQKHSADVIVDFTVPEAVQKHLELALDYRVRPVVGTSGIRKETIEDLKEAYARQKLGAVIAPNFAIGAVLMMKFASIAAKYLPHVEIIESHHDRKIDAPSGTALKTAEMISEARKRLQQGHPDEVELKKGARGAYVDGFRIHSVRLPGLVAHQEVLFGGQGQLLTIRHDSLNRESFMPGVKLAVKKVLGLDSLVYGLENLIETV